MKPTLSRVLVAAMAGSAALAAAAIGRASAAAPQEAGWPQWLGPARDGTSPASGIVPTSGSVKLRVAWRGPLGVGPAGLAVAGDRLVTLDSDGPQASAVALATADGALKWRVPLDEGIPDEERGPSSTPAVKGGLVFVLSPACQLRALDLATGRPAWHVDLKARFGAAPVQGCASSPLVDGERVIVQPGAPNDNRVVALDRRTGAPAWTAKGVFRASYSSPGLRNVGGEREVLVHHTDTTEANAPKGGITALRSSDGQLAWHTTLERFWSYATPVPFGEDKVLLVTWNDAAAFSAPAAGAEAALVWRVDAFSYYVSPPVYHDGHLYGYGGDFLRCVRASDGATVWQEKTYPGSVVLADGHLVVLSVASGLVRIVEATPAGYREKARLEALAPGARAETPPSIQGRRIFVRNDEEVVAVDLVS
jgi:outer membrane protein assembly factor BamB